MKYAVSNGCVICGECMFSCAVGAIKIDKNGAHIDPEKCVGCGQCADNCAAEAIQPMDE